MCFVLIGVTVMIVNTLIMIVSAFIKVTDIIIMIDYKTIKNTIQSRHYLEPNTFQFVREEIFSAILKHV